MRDSLQYAQPRDDRARRLGRAGRDPDGAHPAERCREASSRPKSTSRLWIVWPHISSVRRPITRSPPVGIRAQGQAALSRRASRGDRPTSGALLGRLAAGILRPRRCLAAQPEGEIFVILMTRTPAASTVSTVFSRRCRARCDPDQRGDSRRSSATAPVWALEVLKWMARVVQLQEKQRQSPSACRRQQCRAHSQRGLSLPDGGAGAQLCGAR
jgi:hypothetical protein